MADGTRENADPKPLPSVEATVKLAAAAPALGTIRFINPLEEWAAGTGTILATRDGGQTWQEQYRGPGVVTDMAFSDARHGWAAAGDGILQTSDGGAHWAPLEISAAPLQGMALTGPGAGWVVAGGDLYRTAARPRRGQRCRRRQGGR